MNREIYFEPPTEKEELVWDIIKSLPFIIVITALMLCAFCDKV